ncbi:unnamed protein product [Timema podura]|uniref:Uncharacterized protein n=1 Tax=Timema podura TaxID=61482 RepID=A0ABN7NVR4_TIMPD|nr:unnamed protein product [Timema podura]
MMYDEKVKELRVRLTQAEANYHCYLDKTLKQQETLIESAKREVTLQQHLTDKAAPITFYTAWITPQSMFSEPSVTSSPLYSAPMKTPLSMGSLGGHYLSGFPRHWEDPFSPIGQGQAAVEGI